VLVGTLRRVGLRFTQFADASAQTIRLKLLKLGAQVQTSVRRIQFAMASGCPNKVEFELAHIYLLRAFSSAKWRQGYRQSGRRCSQPRCLSSPTRIAGKARPPDSHCASQMNNASKHDRMATFKCRDQTLITSFTEQMMAAFEKFRLGLKARS
jgi:hypothetical protein